MQVLPDRLFEPRRLGELLPEGGGQPLHPMRVSIGTMMTPPPRPKSAPSAPATTEEPNKIRKNVKGSMLETRLPHHAARHA